MPQAAIFNPPSGSQSSAKSQREYGLPVMPPKELGRELRRLGVEVNFLPGSLDRSAQDLYSSGGWVDSSQLPANKMVAFKVCATQWYDGQYILFPRPELHVAQTTHLRVPCESGELHLKAMSQIKSVARSGELRTPEIRNLAESLSEGEFLIDMHFAVNFAPTVKDAENKHRVVWVDDSRSAPSTFKVLAAALGDLHRAFSQRLFSDAAVRTYRLEGRAGCISPTDN
jgi:hypothetical protein